MRRPDVIRMEMIVFSIFTPNTSHWAWGPRPHPVRPHLHSGRLQRRFSISGPILRPWVDMKTRDTVQSSATSCEASIQPDPCRRSALGRSLPASQSPASSQTRADRVLWAGPSSLSEPSIQPDPCRRSALGRSLPASQSLKCHICYS